MERQQSTEVVGPTAQPSNKALKLKIEEAIKDESNGSSQNSDQQQQREGSENSNGTSREPVEVQRIGQRRILTTSGKIVG